MCWNRWPSAQEMSPQWESALCPAHSACLSLGGQPAVLGLCFSWAPVLSSAMWMVCTGFSKCTKWGLCCDNCWETVLGFCILRDAEGLEEPGKSTVQRANNQPGVAGWNLPLCCLAGLEGSLPWPFFWGQGCCPRRSCSSWSCNAVLCSSTAASWPLLPSRAACWGSHALKS